MTAMKVKDTNGFLVKGWSFETFKGVQVGNGLDKSRSIRGWSIRSHDGCVRHCEGNWQQFVPFAQLVVSNYGFKTNLS